MRSRFFLLLFFFMSQSLLLFRAFQRTISKSRGRRYTLSQSLLLFRAFQPRSTTTGKLKRSSRNPFFYSGHFNYEEVEKGICIYCMESQSLLLFRAFQLKGKGWRSESGFSRNPFFYSGHFNMLQLGSIRKAQRQSQSLLLFRAFQLFLRRRGECQAVGVAIPSFIQGISTRLTIFLDEEQKYVMSQSLLLFRAFQHISIST